MIVTYKWASGSHISADPARAAEVFDGIVEREGRLSPDAVLRESEPLSAPLHDYFEWNNADAADKYRRDQARHLIRSFVVVHQQTEEKPEHATRAFVSMSRLNTPDTDTANAYVPVQMVMRDDDMRRSYLASIVREIESFQRRYESVEELAEFMPMFGRAAESVRRGMDSDAHVHPKRARVLSVTAAA